jgi:hypothetical protein
MCNVCGINCGKGGALRTHIQGAHKVSYDAYRRCFYGDDVKTIIADGWDDTIRTSKGQNVLVHVLVRRFINNPGPRGATRAARTVRRP